LTTVTKNSGHFARYHTQTITGYAFNDSPEPFAAFSGSSVNHLVGAHVWLMERKNDRYFIQAVFIVDQVGPTPTGAEMDLANQVQGRVGICFIDLEVGNQPWWKEFFKSIGNGGLAICPIRPEYVELLKGLTGLRLEQTDFIAT
jgi:hypothetical protein